ncbi:IS1381 transposase protein A, truncation [Streptococcus pneumoniae]|nr:IS1381 transposase protein A, truncation [Streptococcus pneumoniae]
MCENIELMKKLRLILVFTDFGIHERNLLRRSQWVEVTLVQSGVTISKTHLSAENTVIVDATEVKINRPKKIN